MRVRFQADRDLNQDIVIPQDAPVGHVVDTLILIWAASEPEEWQNRITKIPF